jgi:hypothetical protein
VAHQHACGAAAALREFSATMPSCWRFASASASASAFAAATSALAFATASAVAAVATMALPRALPPLPPRSMLTLPSSSSPPQIHDADGKPIMDRRSWHGFVPDFWDDLSKHCHFDYTIRLPGEVSDSLADFDFNESTTTMRSYGRANKDVWEYNRSDIYMSSFYVSGGRLQNSLMTQPIMNTPLQLGELASAAKASAGGIADPFHWVTWMMWFVTTGIAALTFWYLDTGSAGENFLRHKRADAANLAENFWMSYWLSWSSLTGGNAHRPTTGLGRAFSGVWTFFCLIMIATYTANLAAWLTASTLSTDIESFSHMRDTGKKLCVLKNTAYARYLEENWKGIQIVGRTASVWEEGGMVEGLLNGDCDAFTDSGIYMHYAQHSRCNAMLDPDVVAWSRTKKCKGACQKRLMKHLLLTDQKIIMAPEKVEFGLQDNAIGLHKRHAAALDDLNFQIFDMRMSGKIARLMNLHKLDRPPLKCLGASTEGMMDQIAFEHLSLAFYMVFGSAGILVLIKLLRTWRDGGQGHDLLIEFLSKHYPREQFKPQEIVREWEGSWQLRWTMHPLVKRHLRSIDEQKMRAWVDRGSRIRNVDMVSWAKAHEHDGDANGASPSAKLAKKSTMSPYLAGAGRQLSQSSVLRLRRRGSEIHDQFTGDDYMSVFEAQKQQLLKTLVHISSGQLEAVMRRELFGGQGKGLHRKASSANASVTKMQVAHRMTLAATMEKGSSASTSTSLRKVAPSAGDDGAVGGDSVRAVGASLIEVAPADMPADTEL